jgi:hypothetical protein
MGTVQAQPGETGGIAFAASDRLLTTAADLVPKRTDVTGRAT